MRGVSPAPASLAWGGFPIFLAHPSNVSVFFLFSALPYLILLANGSSPCLDVRIRPLKSLRSLGNSAAGAGVVLPETMFPMDDKSKFEFLFGKNSRE